MVLFDDSHEKFQLHDKGFVYKKKSYKYTDIIHISYEGIITDYKMNFVSMDELREAICEIELKNGKKIKHIIEEGQYLVGFSQDKIKLIEELKKVYIRLLKESFESRLACYLREIEQLGYCSYIQGERLRKHICVNLSRSDNLGCIVDRSTQPQPDPHCIAGEDHIGSIRVDKCCQ